MRTRRAWPVKAFILVMLVLAMATTAFAASPIDEPGTKMIECPDCATLGVVLSEEGQAVPCDTCGGTGYTQAESQFYNTALSLLPPVVAIGLALITKEVYSSLFIGIVVGGLLFSNFSFEGTINHVFSGGIVAQLSDSYNVGILIFLVILGTLVCLMNKAGGSAAFGRWAKQNIKSRAGAQLASILLGCLIFIDDYFNCLTVGSVMRPITDKHRVSRAKLAYIIDATAAPVCIIAPISSWAAAVSAFAEDGQGLNLFIRAIPFNYYAILTIIMMVGMALMKTEFGPSVCPLVVPYVENHKVKCYVDLIGMKAYTYEDGHRNETVLPDMGHRLEGLVGIPGSVGGAIAMNAGSFGCEVGPHLASVRFYDGTQIRDAAGAQLSYGYRHMRLPGEAADYLVLSGTFSLTRKAKDDISLFMRHNFFEKKSKQPVTAWSAGCVFKNPAPDRSAGKLLDAAGFRGKALGGMMFSPLHANFLVNTGKGSAQAAFDLMQMAEEEVRRRFAVTLEPEVRILS